MKFIGIILIVIGIVSFLIEQIPHWATLIFLLVGAGITVKYTWFANT